MFVIYPADRTIFVFMIYLLSLSLSFLSRLYIVQSLGVGVRVGYCEYSSTSVGVFHCSFIHTHILTHAWAISLLGFRWGHIGSDKIRLSDQSSWFFNISSKWRIWFDSVWPSLSNDAFYENSKMLIHCENYSTSDTSNFSTLFVFL
jgi:hypothetical protein